MNEKPCTRENLRIQIIGNSDVNDNGEPSLPVYDDISIENIHNPYYCDNHCPDTSFATWEEALAHLKEQKEVAR